MSGRYVVHARRFSGSLAAPSCDETESVDSDDLQWAVRTAEDLSRRRGMSVWVYEDRSHDLVTPTEFSPRPAPPGGRYHVVAEWRPGGARLR